MSWRWAIAGLLLVASQAAIGALLVSGASPQRLRVELSGEPDDATVPPGLRERVERTVDGVAVGELGHLASLEGQGPGIRRVEWAVRYRGGFERRVGLSRLVGPFQSATDPPCGVRVHLGQALLDDGRAGPGTLAHLAKKAVGRALSGTRAIGVGRFERVERLALRWSDRRGGSLEVWAALQYRRARVPLLVVATPRLADGRVRWKTRTRVNVRVDNRTVAWVLDAVGLQPYIDEEATEIGAEHVAAVAAALSSASQTLPPIELGDLGRVRVAYCDEPISIQPDVAATIPMRVLLPPAKGGNAFSGPVAFGRDASPEPDPEVSIGIDIDLDTLNAVAFQLYDSGALDRALESVDPGQWFNQSAVVRRFLSLRVGDVRLAMPPVIEHRPTAGAAAGPFSLALEAKITLEDGGLRTPARLFSRIGFGLGERPGPGLLSEFAVDELQLTCRPTMSVLEPCYGAIVSAVRGRTSELFEPVSTYLGEALAQWTRQRRWEIAGGNGSFAIEDARVGNFVKGRSVWLRFRASALFLP